MEFTEPLVGRRPEEVVGATTLPRVCSPTLPPRRVLIVEDHESSRAALRRILTSLGFEVSTNWTVAEGMAALSPPPDCILLDLDLPDGSGELILEKVRAEALNCRVVVSTAESETERLMDADRQGADAVLLKPFGLAELVAACRL